MPLLYVNRSAAFTASQILITAYVLPRQQKERVLIHSYGDRRTA